MTINNDKIHERLVREVHQHLNTTKSGSRHTILQITVNGSSGKGIASDQSDFDLKVLLIHSQNDYLLQKVKESWHSTFTFEYENDDEDAVRTTNTIEVDVMFIDYLRMAKYIAKSDMTAYEIFSGDIIYDSPQAKALNELWKQAYLPRILAGQYSGLLFSYLKKPPIENHTRSNKIAFEAVYLEIKLRFIEAHGASRVPPFKASELLERANNNFITEEEKRWAEELLKARREQKNGDMDSKHNEKFESFVRHGPPRKINWDADLKDRNKKMQERLEGLFLDVITERQ